MAEEFSVFNDYTLEVGTSFGSGSNHSFHLTRLFNFKAQQVTSIYRDWITSNGAAVSTQVLTQNFDEIQGKAELRDMHGKLEEIGGHPPALEEIFGEMNKPAAKLRSLHS